MLCFSLRYGVTLPKDNLRYLINFLLRYVTLRYVDSLIICFILCYALQVYC
jgi:hypothetical protein